MVTLIYLESLVYGLLFAMGMYILGGYVYLYVLNDIVLRIVTLALVLIVIIVVSLLVRVVIF